MKLLQPNIHDMQNYLQNFINFGVVFMEIRILDETALNWCKIRSFV